MLMRNCIQGLKGLFTSVFLFAFPTRTNEHIKVYKRRFARSGLDLEICILITLFVPVPMIVVRSRHEIRDPQQFVWKKSVLGPWMHFFRTLRLTRSIAAGSITNLGLWISNFVAVGTLSWELGLQMS